MGLDLQSDLCSLLIDDVIYHEAAVRQAGAEALSQAVARYQRQAAEVMGRLMEIYQEKLYVSDWGRVSRWVGYVLFVLWFRGQAVGLSAPWAFSFLSVAAATPSAGCFGPSDFRIPSGPVGSQVKPCLVLRLGFLRCTCRKEAECPDVKAGGESGCLGQCWLHTILHPWTSAFCFSSLVS